MLCRINDFIFLIGILIDKIICPVINYLVKNSWPSMCPTHLKISQFWDVGHIEIEVGIQN